MDQVTINACVGDTRITNVDIWFVPKGNSTYELTYCDWCITNGCIPLDSVSKVEEKLCRCNCDCPNKHNHECIKVYVCKEHHGDDDDMVLTLPAMRQCKLCPQMSRTWGEEYCDGCSAIYQICKYCGEK